MIIILVVAAAGTGGCQRCTPHASIDCCIGVSLCLHCPPLDLLHIFALILPPRLTTTKLALATPRYPPPCAVSASAPLSPPSCSPPRLLPNRTDACTHCLHLLSLTPTSFCHRPLFLPLPDARAYLLLQIT